MKVLTIQNIFNLGMAVMIAVLCYQINTLNSEFSNVYTNPQDRVTFVTPVKASEPENTVVNSTVAERDAMAYGNENAPYTLEVFTDVECPFCRKMHTEIQEAVERSSNTLNWKVRHFPLSRHGEPAIQGAMLLECVNRSYGSEKAFDMLAAIYSRTGGSGRGVGDIKAFAKEHGVSGAIVSLCLKSPDINKIVQSDYNYGKRMGVTGTPAMILVDNATGKKQLIAGYMGADELISKVVYLSGSR